MDGPQKRMLPYSDERPAGASLLKGQRDSDQSISTHAFTDAGKQENVLVCVRVRPPFEAIRNGPLNNENVEEAWIADSAERTIRLADKAAGAGAEYRFGEFLPSIAC